jgi:hypothetical protein
MDSIREGVFQIPALLIALVFFIVIFTLNFLGYSTRKRLSKLYPEKELELGTGEGALLGLMGLLLAFSFGMAATKYESRRQKVIDEVNLLNSAILRIDLFADTIKQSYQKGFKNYLECRINYYEAGSDPEKIYKSLEDAQNQFNQLWKHTVQLYNDPGNRSRIEPLVPSLMGMKNIMVDREAGRVAAVPTLIIVVSLLLVMVGSFLIGFGIKPGKRSSLFSFAYALMTTIVLYLIMELSRPREGFVNLKSAEMQMVELRKLFP